MKSLFVLAVYAALTGCAAQLSREQLLEANRQYDAALVSADAAALDRLYLDDFIYIGGVNAEKRDKKQQIAAMTSGSAKLLEGRSEDIQTKHFDGIAVLTGTFVGRVRIKDKDMSFRELYSTVWKQHEGQWRLVLEHGSMVGTGP